MNKNNVVIGVIGSDIHVVGSKVIAYALQGAGFQVTNIGIFSTQEDFINAARETDSAAILISSLYGHGEMDCRGFKEKCVEAGLKDVKLYVGGNLMVGKQEPEVVRKCFTDMGFDRVALENTMPDEVIKWLKEDLGS